ncbi:MAG: hypothetical protein KGH72_03255 [Candidatus Micrarchaeota archaeon]|nr:hypothetical protein [Candidatus Micrarchaeota archaeon]
MGLVVASAKTVKANADKKSKRMQTAIEYLSIYSWALIILIIAIVVISYLALNRGNTAETFLPSTCYLSTELNCQNIIFMSNMSGAKALIIFKNDLPTNISFASSAFTIVPGFSGASYKGNCYPANAVPGSTVSCTVNLANYNAHLGAQLNPKLEVSYKLCANGKCASQVNTSGSSTVYVSSLVSVRGVTLYTNTRTGDVSVNGVPYPSGTTVLFIGNHTYGISAVPPPKYSFVNWTYSSSITLSSAAAQTTNASTSSNGTITAVFVGPPGVSLTAQETNTTQGSHDLLTAQINGGTSPDTVVICGNSSVLGAMNSGCVDPNGYLASSGASGSGTYDTVGLPSGLYTMQACDATYHSETGKTECSSTLNLVIEPGVSISIQSTQVLIGQSDIVTGSATNVSNNVTVCDDYSGHATYYGCGNVAYNKKAVSGIGTASINTDTYPLTFYGRLQFVACDSSFYKATGRPDCTGPLSQDVYVKPIVTLSFSTGSATWGLSDPGTAYVRDGAGNIVPDTVVICGTFNSGSGYAACAAPYNYGPYASGTGTTAWDAGTGNGYGTYTYEACDASFYYTWGVLDCSAPQTVTITPLTLTVSMSPGGVVDPYGVSCVAARYSIYPGNGGGASGQTCAGAGYPDPSSPQYVPYGAVVDYVATDIAGPSSWESPSSGWSLAGWSTGGNANPSDPEIPMTGSANIQGTFYPCLTTGADFGDQYGPVYAAWVTGAGCYPYGSTVGVTIKPPGGKQVCSGCLGLWYDGWGINTLQVYGSFSGNSGGCNTPSPVVTSDFVTYGYVPACTIYFTITGPTYAYEPFMPCYTAQTGSSGHGLVQVSGGAFVSDTDPQCSAYGDTAYIGARGTAGHSFNFWDCYNDGMQLAAYGYQTPVPVYNAYGYQCYGDQYDWNTLIDYGTYGGQAASGSFTLTNPAIEVAYFT